MKSMGRAGRAVQGMVRGSALVVLPVLAAVMLAPAAVAQGAQGAQQGPTRVVVAAEGNEARYRIREQLAGFDLPNDAIGKTAGVTGQVVLGGDGRILRDSSRIVIDLASMASDQARRDNYVRRNVLRTDSFPTAVFVPTGVRGIASPAAALAAGTHSYELLGDLTIRGVTRPVAWQVRSTATAAGAVTGTATTSFNFAEFGLPQPRVPIVLSVDDLIKLEFDFRMSRAGRP
jgi:polyisoprenoid-binding protein YceI